jgi:hypothetical protein
MFRDREAEFRSLQMQARLAEYNSLRQESLSAITNRATIANFMFGALAVIIAALVAQSKANWATAVVSAFFVPQISKAGLAIWLGEYERSQRAGRKLSDIEAEIGKIAGARVMSWETRLVGRNLHMGYPYLATALLLMGAGYVSGGIGIFLLYLLVTPAVPLWLLVLLGLGLVGLIVGVEWWFLRFVRRTWKRIRIDYAAKSDSPFAESNI